MKTSLIKPINIITSILFNNKYLAYWIYGAISFIILINNLSFIESYEAVLSAYAAQEYYHISCEAFFFDVNLFVLPIISALNTLIPGVQLFGYFLFFETFIIGFIALRIIQNIRYINISDKKFITISFLILYLPNFLLLSSTRIATVAIFVFYYYYRKNSSLTLGLFLLFIFCNLIRLDAFILLSILYVSIATYKDKRLNIKNFVPLIGGLLTLFSYEFFVKHFLSETFNMFYFYELDILDRFNITSNHLTNKEKVTFSLFVENEILDQEFYQLEFLDKILNTNTSHLTNALFNPKLYINTFINSIDEIKNSWPILSITLITLSIASWQNSKKIILNIFLFIFPLSACLYIALPVRFLYPYFVCIILFTISATIFSRKIKTFLLFIFVSLTLIHIISIKKSKRDEANLFFSTMQRAKELETELGKTLYFESLHNPNWKFVNSQINYKYEGNQYRFFEYFLDFVLTDYIEQWEAEGCIEPMSILNRIKFLEKTETSLIIGNDNYEYVIEEYLKNKYNYHTNMSYIHFHLN